MLNPQQQEQLLSEENFASFFQSINPAINPNLNHCFPQPVLPTGFLSESDGDDLCGGFLGENAALKSQIVVEIDDCSTSTAASVFNSMGDNSAISSGLCNSGSSVIEDQNMVPKKTKLSQLVRCEICDIDFNCSIVYTRHMSGKRHKKKSEMLNIINTTGGSTVAEAVNLAIAEGLETKRQKLIESSWTVFFMRFCTMCDVVCNTQEMYDKHLAGKKHATQARKLAQDVQELSVAANPNSISSGGPAVLPQDHNTSDPNKTHTDQFTWCEVCSISCTSKDVLGIHKQGKKHLRNMKKVNTITSDLLIGQMEELGLVKTDESNSDKVDDSQAMLEDLETQKWKITERSVKGSKLSDSAPEKSPIIVPKDMKVGGSEGDSTNKGTHKIASCDVCNIYCTSEDLLVIHKLGKKHLKKQEKFKTEMDTSISTPINAPASMVPELRPINERKNDHVTKSHVLEDDSEAKSTILEDNRNEDELDIGNEDDSQAMIEDSGNMEGSVKGSKLSDSVPYKSNTFFPKDMKSGGSKGDGKNKGTHRIANCDVCNIYCTSEDLLVIHKLGKKHLKKQEKLKTETNTSIPIPIDGPASMVQKQRPTNELTKGNVTKTQAWEDVSETNITTLEHSGEEDEVEKPTADSGSVYGTSPTVLSLGNESGGFVIGPDKVNSDEFVFTNSDSKTDTIDNQADTISAGQFAGCEVCNIYCNSIDVLAKHKSGKKHLKKLEKVKINDPLDLQANQVKTDDLKNKNAINSHIPKTDSDMMKLEVTEIEEVGGAFRFRSNSEDLETKKRKILEGIRKQDEVEKPIAANIFSVHGASPVLPEENKNGTVEIKWNNINIDQEASENLDNKTSDLYLWCEVCDIYCNSKDVLTVHKSGKKHLKRMEKIKTDDPQNVHAKQETRDGVKNQIEIELQRPNKELERMTKPEVPQIQDVGGPFRLCTICSVFCSSQVVLDSHLAGQKHASLMRKLGTSTAGYTFAVAR